jgi:hypothetical protein
MNPQFALQKDHNKHPSQSSTTTKLLHYLEHIISQSIIHHHPQQTSLGFDTKGGGVEVDSGSVTMTKSGALMT